MTKLTPPGVFRHIPQPPLAHAPSPETRRKRKADPPAPQPLLDAEADHEWLRANRSRLGRVHVIPLDLGFLGFAVWPSLIIAVRVHDTTLPDGWRPAWLEIVPDGLYDTWVEPPTFTPAQWAAADPIAEAGMILAVIEYAARTRPDAMLIRAMLVSLTSATLGHASDDFTFVPLND